MKHAYLARLSLDKMDSMPLHRQLFLQLRDCILQAILKPETRLPSSRLLANDLGISRNTVLSAFDQLAAEGYITSRIGAGSYITDNLPEQALRPEKDIRDTPLKSRNIRLSQQAQALYLAKQKPPYRQGPFSPGLPELDRFPFAIWARLLAKHWRQPKPEYLCENPVGGSIALREALADYLGQTRAVKCKPEQVIILSGSQQAIHLVIKAFAENNDPVLMEDPGYPGTLTSILAAGARPVPVPVDDEGFSLTHAQNLAPDARLACLSPSHQYPLGPTMSLRRRLDILNWAKANDAFVLEDDYDSEYRYTGHPISSLQGLDTDNRVLYVGSMSKVMFSGLRIGYLVVPEDLVSVFLALRRDIDGHSPAVAEAALADFISDGHLSSHIRKMRLLYQSRQEMLISLLRQKCRNYLTINQQDCGMHLVAYIDQRIADTRVAGLCNREGVMLRALSSFYQGPSPRNALIIGFAGTDVQKMPQLVNKLAAILKQESKKRTT